MSEFKSDLRVALDALRMLVVENDKLRRERKEDMTREDIIRLFERANGWSPKGFDKTLDELERFAALVWEMKR